MRREITECDMCKKTRDTQAFKIPYKQSAPDYTMIDCETIYKTIDLCGPCAAVILTQQYFNGMSWKQGKYFLLQRNIADV